MTTRRGLSASVHRRSSDGWNPLTLALLAGVWLAVLPNWPLWQTLAALSETGSARGLLFVAGFGVMIAAVMTMLLAVFSWPRWIRGSVSFLLISAALGAHFMGSYGAVIDSTMMVTVLQTDAREVRDLLNLRLVLNLLVLAFLPMLFVWTVPVARIAGRRQLVRNLLGMVAALALTGFLVLALFADLSATMRNHKTIRYLVNPLNSLYALVDIGWRAKTVAAAGPPRPIGLTARPLPRAVGAKPPLLLLVIGETARADHFALNGYPRATDPELSAVEPVSFTAVTSCGTNTAASLPCMFSALGKEAFNARAGDQENLLDLVQRAGYAVLWLDNQAGCKGLCERVPHAVASEAPQGVAASAGDPDAARRKALCADGECLDEALLTGLLTRLTALPAERRAKGVLIVLHQMGSHGPAYFKRSPEDRKPFLPECRTSVLQQCDRASLVNGYDNSIAYTDHVLALAVRWLIDRLPEYDPSLIYVSDHGESLGENGIYLHGLPYRIAPRDQTHVPWIAWVSPLAERRGGLSIACLRSRKDIPLTHDNLFHSALGLLAIQTDEYRPALDAFAACRRQP